MLIIEIDNFLNLVNIENSTTNLDQEKLRTINRMHLTFKREIKNSQKVLFVSDPLMELTNETIVDLFGNINYEIITEDKFKQFIVGLKFELISCKYNSLANRKLVFEHNSNLHKIKNQTLIDNANKICKHFAELKFEISTLPFSDEDLSGVNAIVKKLEGVIISKHKKPKFNG